MENLSALKLFNAAIKADVSQNASVSSSSASSASSDSSDGVSGFENVFKSYLDRTQDTQDSQQTAQSSQASGSQKTQTVSTDTSTQNTKEPESPQDVIDSLNIPDEAKDELKKMLSEIDSKDDADAFLQQLMAMMQGASMTVAQVEKTLSDLATTLMQQTTPVGQQPKISPILLEKTLDTIVALQTSKQEPQALFQLPGTETEQKLTIINQTAQTQTGTQAEAETPQVLQQNQQTAQEAISSKIADKAAAAASQEAKPAEVTVAQVKAAETAENVADNVVELVTKVESDSKSQDTPDNSGSDFLARTPLTEKVITTEIKIEKPQDIMKFAELVEIAKNQNASKITVQLHPQEMGKVNIELTEHAGKITGKVTFDNENARNLFASGADNLKQMLADKGVVVENLEFLFKDLDHHQFAGWDNKQNKSGGSSDSSDTTDADDDAPEETDNSVIYA